MPTSDNMETPHGHKSRASDGDSSCRTVSTA
jgi:hypothetical protein